MQPANRIFAVGFIILIWGCWTSCAGTEKDSTHQPVTTVILIRHVERDNFFIVTPAGHERAKALIGAVSDMNIMAIYSPDLERNLDSVRPLAKHLNIDITLTPRFNEKTIDKIVSDILSKHRWETVLIVGNGSGNLRAIHQKLGGKGEGPYPYGEMFLYTIPDQGPAEVIKSSYGS
jgi:hypothetical protein